MPLQPYFPEPQTVAGNVASWSYKDRTKFVRSLVIGHFGTNCLVGLIATVIDLHLAFSQALVCTVAGICVLSLQRRFWDRGLRGNSLSAALLLPTLLALSQLYRVLHEAGFPVMSMIPAMVGLALYSAFCGNDFSYVGQFVLCFVATGGVLLAMSVAGWIEPARAVLGLAFAAAYLCFFAYDLSMIVKRRRGGEQISALADLYRDLGNFATYPARVYFHWRKLRFL